MTARVNDTPIAVFVGAPGSGKTKIGKRVARLLDAEFVDTDKRIAAEHGPIADIFETHGEAHFRRIERVAVAAALREPAIVSLGGGAVIDAETRAALVGRRVVRLTVSAEAVAGRITGGKRPLLSAGVEAWKTLVEARQPLYEQVASKTWDTSSRPMDRIAQDIAEWIAADTRALATAATEETTP